MCVHIHCKHTCAKVCVCMYKCVYMHIFWKVHSNSYELQLLALWQQPYITRECHEEGNLYIPVHPLGPLNYSCVRVIVCSVPKLCLTLWPHRLAHQASLTSTIFRSLFKLIHFLTISSSATHFFFCFSLSQHQGLFQWAGSWHQVAKVLELQF